MPKSVDKILSFLFGKLSKKRATQRAEVGEEIEPKWKLFAENSNKRHFQFSLEKSMENANAN